MQFRAVVASLNRLGCRLMAEVASTRQNNVGSHRQLCNRQLGACLAPVRNAALLERSLKSTSVHEHPVASKCCFLCYLQDYAEKNALRT
jgi:hypothetical protein